MTDFRGETIWIIGASTGMGRALALELAARQAVLILSARDAGKLDALCAELGGGPHHVLPMDVTDGGQVASAFARLSALTPRLDRVIYMAGTYEPMPFAQMRMDAAATIIATNLTGALDVVLRALPLLKQQKSGQIVLCASVAGYRGLPNAQPYGATKAALINLAESLRIETDASGIDVKIINPGFVRTPMTDKNTFRMPMMIEADQAARRIADGLLGRAFEIHFPRRFTFLMKFLQYLPFPLYRRLVRL